MPYSSDFHILVRLLKKDNSDKTIKVSIAAAMAAFLAAVPDANTAAADGKVRQFGGRMNSSTLSYLAL